MIYLSMSLLALGAGFAGLAWGWWLDREERRWRRALFWGTITITQGIDVRGGEVLIVSGTVQQVIDYLLVVYPECRDALDPVNYAALNTPDGR